MICPCKELEACARKGKDKILVCPERRSAENMKYQGQAMIEAIDLFLDRFSIARILQDANWHQRVTMIS
jgi:hypothetical protein